MQERWRVNVQRIEESRLRHLWTVGDLAREARVSRPTVSKLLSEKRRPNMQTLQLLARALGLDYPELIVFMPPSPTEEYREPLRAS